MENKAGQQYIRRISRRMPVGGTQKKQFLAALQENVACFLQENPRASISQLDACFGSPNDIAADFIAQMPYRQINYKFRARNRVVAIVSAVAALIVLIWATAVLYVIARDHPTSNSHFAISDVIQHK